MSVHHTPWHELPTGVHQAVRARLGSDYRAVPVHIGANSGTAAVLTLPNGTRLFVKGQDGRAPREILEPAGDAEDGSDWWGPGWGPVDQLGEEVRVNPYLPAASPEVLWQVGADGWHLVAFRHVDGTHADYRPESSELHAVVRALGDITSCAKPRIRLPTAVDRWGYYCDARHRRLLLGESLLHTDPAAVNVLVDASGDAHFVDWAWPAVGAAFIDAALWGMRLVAGGGHEPASAAGWVMKAPGWAYGEPDAVRAFTRAEARRWQDLAEGGTGGADGVVGAAVGWADYWDG